MTLLQMLQADLPNFPTELLSEWLLPYANTEGWPPAPRAGDEPQGRCRYLIRKKSLDYWKTVAWRSIERHVSYSDLHKQNQEVVLLMVLGAVTGHSNLYSNSIPDLKQRFYRILEHLRSRGTLPCPPALMAEPGGLTVLDGNHRMAAYQYAYGYFNLGLDADLQVKTQELQRYWIGEA